jgi:hypothetical protein
LDTRGGGFSDESQGSKYFARFRHFLSFLRAFRVVVGQITKDAAWGWWFGGAHGWWRSFVPIIAWRTDDPDDLGFLFFGARSKRKGKCSACDSGEAEGPDFRDKVFLGFRSDKVAIEILMVGPADSFGLGALQEFITDFPVEQGKIPHVVSAFLAESFRLQSGHVPPKLGTLK